MENIHFIFYREIVTAPKYWWEIKDKPLYKLNIGILVTINNSNIRIYLYKLINIFYFVYFIILIDKKK